MQTDKPCDADKSVGSTDGLEVPDGYWDKMVAWLRSAKPLAKKYERDPFDSDPLV